MNTSVELTEELMAFLKHKERTGLYTSRSEIVRDALRRMMTDDLLVAASAMSMEEFSAKRRNVGEEIVRKRFPELL